MTYHPILPCIIGAFVLTSCTTPKTLLKHPDTGQIVRCGGSATGSMAGGFIGYHIEKSNAQECVSDHLEQGFRRMHTSYSAESVYDEKPARDIPVGRKQ